MPLLAPLNDRACLGKLHESVTEYMQTPEARELASQFTSIAELRAFIRHLQQRDDLGDPRDGPRIACEVSQRLRLPTWDPNCYERLAMFLALALLINPELQLSSATTMLDNGMHSFPVEMRDGRPHVVVLDPVTAPLRNAMSATAYELRNASPMSDRHIGPWFTGMARSACTTYGATDCYRLAMNALRHSLLTGRPLRRLHELECMLDLARRDASLYGPRGRAAYDRVCGSLRNLSLAIDTGKLQRYIEGLLDTSQPLATEAIKAALIAKFGPAAAIALQGTNVGTAKPSDGDESTAEAPAKQPEKAKHKPTREQKRQSMRRMTLAFREPKSKED